MTNYFSSVEIFHIPQTAFSSNQPDSCTSGTLLKTDFYAEDGRHIYLKLPHHEKDNSWGMESIQEMGRKLMKSKDLSERNCDLILEGYCG